LFISFGGYLALPLVLAAKLTGVPIITHEQTRSFGLANHIIAKLANEVAVSYPESLQHFPKTKTTLTGSLVRTAIKRTTPQPKWFKLTTKKPILYVTGGSQGSEIINMTFAQIINQLVKKWVVIHQCGPQSKARNYARELKNVKSNLSLKLKSHYFVKEWLNETELAWIYNHASLVVGRAGANTVAELRLHQLPAILIPLSLAHNNEQMQNALSLTQAGGALIINQNELSPTKLLDTIDQAKSQLAKMKRNLTQLKPELNGVEKFAQLALKYLD
jgi:UDP-N-acetylglucosamine--N-acetylmuramyl-(pentapeptide) pyrophosphoryl-undecaprenol N-acetylglucosamine transferase